jgi:DNA polymerase elongation subunit (family B)
MNSFKRLYFDIEVSPNIGFFWNPGTKISIGHDSIIQERAIMCICWKWEGEKKVHSLEWDKGNDKKLLQNFIKIINEADEVIGHNGDNYDIKWLRTRCLIHRIPAFPKYQTLDTLKLSRKYFRFNSNKLDYISKITGGDGKTKTEYSWWKQIVLFNDQTAMNKMVKYCKKDVLELERVHQVFKPYTEAKIHVGVVEGGSKIDCPECGSDNTHSRGYSISAAGVKKNRCQCQDCGKWYSVATTTYNTEWKERNRKDKV